MNPVAVGRHILPRQLWRVGYMHSLVSCTRVDKIRRMQRGPAVEKKSQLG